MKIAAAFGLVAMLLAPVIAAQASATGEPVSSEFRGLCEYADRFAPLLKQGDHSFILCDSVVIQRDAGRAVFEFHRDGWGAMIAYEGDLSGDGLTVSSLRRRSGADEAATGECKTIHSNEKISAITCVAKTRGIYYVANFVPSRI